MLRTKSQFIMEKIKTIGLKTAAFGIGLALFSCSGGDGEDGSGNQSKTVDLTAKSVAVEYGAWNVGINVSQYTENYTNEDIAKFIKEGKKVLQVQIGVFDNSDSDVDLTIPPAAFTLDVVSTPKNENIHVDNLISLKMTGYETYDGDIGQVSDDGFLYFAIDESVKPEDLQLNVLNTYADDALITSIPLKQGAEEKEVAENTEIKLANNEVELHTIFGDGLVTINKVVDNYIMPGKEKNAYTKLVRIDYTISADKEDTYCSSSDYKLKSRLFANPMFADEDELEYGKLKKGETRDGFAVFEVLKGDNDYTLLVDDSELKL